MLSKEIQLTDALDLEPTSLFPPCSNCEKGLDVAQCEEPRLWAQMERGLRAGAVTRLVWVPKPLWASISASVEEAAAKS